MYQLMHNLRIEQFVVSFGMKVQGFILVQRAKLILGLLIERTVKGVLNHFKLIVKLHKKIEKMETKYIVYSIADNCSGNWMGNHRIVKDNLTLEEVQTILEDRDREDREARYLGFDKSGCDTLGYISEEEYAAEDDKLREEQWERSNYYNGR